MKINTEKRRPGIMTYTIPQDVLDAARFNVLVHHVNGERVFVKRKRPKKNPLGKLAQGVLHRLTGNLLMMPVEEPADGNVRHESEVLRRLGDLGVRVPRILHVTDDYFVMSDVGKTLEQVFREQPETVGHYLDKTMLALRHFHDLGFAHGGNQMKNFTVLDGEIHFIDFDESIPDRHVEEFQLRDVFLLFLSLERNGYDPDIERLCRVYDGDDGGRTLARIVESIRVMRVARILDNRLLDRLSMRDIRGLLRLIRKAESFSKPQPILASAAEAQ